MHAARAHDRRCEAGVAHGAADRRRRLHVATERPLLVRNVLRHAFVTARARIGIGGLTDARLLRVVELAAARCRQKIETRARKGDTEIAGVLHRAPALDTFLGQKTAAERVIRADCFTHGGNDFQRQPRAPLERTAITVLARIGARQKRRHRIGVRVVQLDAIEARNFRAQGGGCEEIGQHVRQVADMRELHIRHALAMAMPQRFHFARRENSLEPLVRKHRELFAHVGLAHARRAERFAMRVRHTQELLEELVALRPPADRQKVDDLDQQLRMPAACLAYCIGQAFEAGKKTIMPDAQQRPARHVANSSRLDDDGARPPARETAVPVDDIVGDIAVVRRAPRHHRRHPGALLQLQRADPDRREKTRRRGFRRGGNAAGLRLELNALRRAPHGGFLVSDMIILVLR